MDLDIITEKIRDNIKKIDKRIIYALLMLIIFSIGFSVAYFNFSKEGNFTQPTIIHNISQGKEIRFIVVGDPHVRSVKSINRGNERLQSIVNFVNNRDDIDFVVLMGDLADDGKNKTFDTVKDIMKNLNRPYFTVIGNHDIYFSENGFESRFGPMEYIKNINGYQLLFIGITNETTEKGTIILHWKFDFNKANKSAPTIVFLHGAVQGPPPDCTRCRWGPIFFRYGQSMLPELNKFTDLIGVYSGHVHYTSEQIFNHTEYITINGLVTKVAGGIDAIPSEDVGYSVINDSKLDYKLISYNYK